MGTNRQSNHLDYEDEPQSGEQVPPRIIVADEDDQIRHGLASALRADGYTVIEAANGFELLDHLSTSLLAGQPTDKPDGIIMALWMPGVSGLSILGGLRDASWRIPILLLTGCLGREKREGYRRLGANAVFEKPFDVDDLRTVVLNLVPRRGDRISTLPEPAFAQAG
jgi:two-component system, response regulator, stage 0 sporulation protein F